MNNHNTDQIDSEISADQGVNTHSSDSETKLFRVKVLHSNETELCSAPENEDLTQVEYVIIPTRYGRDLGIVLGSVKDVDETEAQDVLCITRIATDEDLERYEANKEREAEAFKICSEKIVLHELDMKLVSAHYILDDPKILFFFTADARVDFRELVKDLVSVFKKRIELRQIGVRDESRVVGGVGVCGRCFCCNGVTDKLKPVSIRMAKEQNLSLNSMKISGPCGRLLCCLSYEYDFYKEEKSRLPQDGSKVYAGKRYFKVVDVNILSRIIKLCDDQGRFFDVLFCKFQYDQDRTRWKVDVSDLDL
ncbi:MAG: stage 0 sporulation family protein [Spirochaetia bacterium]